MTAVGELLRLPDIRHEDIVGTTEEFPLAHRPDLEDIRTLGAKSSAGALATAWVGELAPRTEDVTGGEEAGGIRCPARAAGGDHPVDTVALEDCRRLVLTACRHTHEGSVVGEVVVGELRYIDRHVVLGREDMVRLAVVVDEDRLVARHLPAVKVAHEEHAAFYLTAPLRRPPFLQLRAEELVTEIRRVGKTESDRILTRTDTTRGDEAERALRRVAHRHGSAGGGIALSFELEVEPHDELPRTGIVKHLRPLDDASAFEDTPRRVVDSQHEAAVSPVQQVLRRIEAHAERGVGLACGRARLAVPEVCPFVADDAAAMGIDMLSFRVLPHAAVRRRLGTDGECEEERQKED